MQTRIDKIFKSRKKISKAKLVKSIILYAVLGLLSIYFLFPFFFVLSRSFMSLSEVNSPQIVWWASEMHFENYKVIGEYWNYLLNTLVVIIINGVFIPITGAMIAFPFARYRFPGKKIMFSLLMSTCMLPWVVTSIPIFILYAKLGLINTLASQWIGAFFGGSAMQIFLIIQFMRAIPKTLDEAAYIDGANKLTIFTRIILPQCKSIIIYIAVTIIIGKWNDYMGPLIYIWDETKFTMAVAFYYDYSALGNGSIFINEKMAMAVFMTIPSLIIFAFFQKQMIEGIKIGGVKG